MTISNGLAWSPDGRTMYHADTPTHVDPRVRLRRRDRHAVEPARVRALRRRDRPARRRAPSTATGCYWTRVLSRRQGRAHRRRTASVLAEYPVPAMCPTMCAFGGPDLRDALRDERAPEARRRRARAPAAVGRHLRDARRRARACPSRVRRLTRATAPPCIFDPTAYLRLDAPQSLGASASGASFATSTGDMLEVVVLRPRRVPPARRPEHAARLRPRRRRAPRRARSRSAAPARGRSRPATRRSRSPARRCASACCATGAPVLASITDEHFRGCDAAAGVRPRCARAASGPPRSRSPRASRSTASARNSARSTSAASSSIRRSRTRSASTPASSYKNAPFAWSPGTGNGAWGVVRPHARHGDARRRPSRLVASLATRCVVDDEALDLFLFAARHAGRRSSIATRSSPAARRAVPRWSLGLWVSRAYYKTPEEAIGGRRQAARAHAFPATC